MAKLWLSFSVKPETMPAKAAFVIAPVEVKPVTPVESRLILIVPLIVWPSRKISPLVKAPGRLALLTAMAGC